jgi:hypothetical protein
LARVLGTFFLVLGWLLIFEIKEEVAVVKLVQ